MGWAERRRGPLAGRVRSRLAAVAVVALAGVALPAAPELPRVDVVVPGQAEVHTTWLRPAAARLVPTNDGAATPGWREYAPMRADGVTMVGADWGGDADVEVAVRALRDGVWGPWHPLTHDAEHAPDPGSAEADGSSFTSSDPVWLGRSTSLQVRQRGAVPVELILVEPGPARRVVATGAADSHPSAALAATEQPEILPRASWGADESRVKDPPREWVGGLRFAVVHHTAGRNDYTEEEAPEIVNAIYAYHLSRGWDDIAYNFLVDRFGNVYEGRAGGIDKVIVGGHAMGFNGGSVGVSAIGNFNVEEPPPAMLDALDRLLAWKLDLHHVDPHGETEEISGGGSSARTSAGTRVTLPTVIGHRHTNNTSCPGDLLYEHVAGLNGDQPMNDRLDQIGQPKAYGGQPEHREQPLHGVRPVWDVTFTRPVEWRMEIRDADDQVVRAASGVGEEEAHLAWDMRSSTGDLVEPGPYVAELTAEGAEGPITAVRTLLDVTPAAERIAGDSRVATATALSSWAFTHDNQVVIASSEGFADALVAGPLAGSLGAPVLLVPSSGVPPEVVDEIIRIDAQTAYLIGGEAVLPQVIEDNLRAIGIRTIVRLAGTNRYETAAAVAQEVFEREHPTEGLLALGNHEQMERAFPDALAAAAFGATFEAPVLLVERDALPDATRGKLEQRPWTDGLVVFGGPAAISDEVVEAAAVAAATYGTPAAAEGEDPPEIEPVGYLRFAGTDRYDTARLAAEEMLARWAAKVEEDGPSPYAIDVGWEVVLASGRNWPDALGAGAAAAERGALFLLVDDDDAQQSPATLQFLRDHAADVSHAVVSGGPAAVADAVVDALAVEVAAAGPSTEDPEVWSEDAAAGADDLGELVPPVLDGTDVADVGGT